jgi:transposase
VVFVGKDRKANTLIGFFDQMSPKQRRSIQAVAMDMWDPFIRAVKKNCRRLRSSSIFFTSYQRLAGSSTKIRNIEYRKASKDNKAVFKGARYSAVEKSWQFAPPEPTN